MTTLCKNNNRKFSGCNVHGMGFEMKEVGAPQQKPCGFWGAVYFRKNNSRQNRKFPELGIRKVSSFIYRKGRCVIVLLSLPSALMPRGGSLSKRSIHYLRLGKYNVLPIRLFLHDKKQFSEIQFQEVLALIREHILPAVLVKRRTLANYWQQGPGLLIDTTLKLPNSPPDNQPEEHPGWNLAGPSLFLHCRLIPTKPTFGLLIKVKRL